jgi:hypothetical protein
MQRWTKNWICVWKGKKATGQAMQTVKNKAIGAAKIECTAEKSLIQSKERQVSVRGGGCSR